MDFCTDPLLPKRAKFGVLQQTYGLLLQAKFHLNGFIVPASGGQRQQFWANFDVFGAPVPSPFYRWGPNLAFYSRPMAYAYLPNLVSIGLFCRPLLAKTPNFCRFFGIWHLVLSPIGSILRKVNTGAQLQTFPYSTTSKSFLYSKALMAKSGTQSLRFKSMTNKDRQTDKKINVFGHPGAGEIQAPPDLAGC